MKPRILLFVAYYLPGAKAGGPVRSIEGLADQLGEEYEFRVITSDRDLRDDQPYAGIHPHIWTKVGNAEVLYLRPGPRRLWHIFRELRADRYDAIYLNSVFARAFSIWVLLVRWVGLLDSRPVLLAPRGEFSPGALAIHSWRKRLYLRLTHYVSLYRGVVWHASSQHELADILRSPVVGEHQSVAPPVSRKGFSIAPDIHHAKRSPKQEVQRAKKTVGAASIVFLARISKIKNLPFALECLAQAKGEIELHIYGPQEDPAEWRRCREAIVRLPARIRVLYQGVIQHDQVYATLAKHHFYLLPSSGENFGHGILEAMLSGCVPIISDQTFWRDLTVARAGFDVPLSPPNEYIRALQAAIDMDGPTFENWSRNTRNFAMEKIDQKTILNASRQMFNSLLHQQT